MRVGNIFLSIISLVLLPIALVFLLLDKLNVNGDFDYDRESGTGTEESEEREIYHASI